MYYNSRWYDPSLGRFAQADTIVPPGVQGLDRYAYGLNNPSRFTDPSGHVVCEPGEPCGPGATYKADTTNWIDVIEDKFGVTLKDGGTEHPALIGSTGRSWDLRNMILVYSGLSRINNVLGGRLKEFIGGSTLTLNSHPEAGSIWAETSDTNIDFYTNSTIQLQNLYHEFGHVLDNSLGHVDQFSGALSRLDNPSFLDGNSNNINRDALINDTVFDPYTWNNKADAIQHLNPSADDRYTENWADIFANYMSGNIDTSNPFGPGKAMNDFVTGILP